MSRIIGISGKSGSGKDLVGRMLIEEIYKEYNIRFEILKFAACLKEILAYCETGDPANAILYELDQHRQARSTLTLELMSNRKMMQTFAQAIREAIPDFWSDR